MLGAVLKGLQKLVTATEKVVPPAQVVVVQLFEMVTVYRIVVSEVAPVVLQVFEEPPTVQVTVAVPK